MGAKEYMTMMSDYTKCTYGSMKNQINMRDDHGVLSRKTGKAVLNANDHKWQENILGYGMCSAFCDDNNEYAQLINSAQQNGNRFVRPRVKCVCHARTEEAWRDGDKHFVIEGAPVLTKESTLECRWGGVISFCDPPKPVDDDVPQTMGEKAAGAIAGAVSPLMKNKDEIEKSLTKENIRKMIAEGKLPNPENMDHDYYYLSWGRSRGNGISLGVNEGVILDKMGNVYSYTEVDGSMGVSTKNQVSGGFGDYNGPKQDKKAYKSAMEGMSVGISGAMIVQGGIAKGYDSPVSAEIGLTSGAGVSLNGRETKYLFNVLRDD